MLEATAAAACGNFRVCLSPTLLLLLHHAHHSLTVWRGQPLVTRGHCTAKLLLLLLFLFGASTKIGASVAVPFTPPRRQRVLLVLLRMVLVLVLLGM
jgi:hypothetical protein